MSLVGNLQDLGLDEIFQIAGISGKSGVLRLHHDGVSVRILFEEGRIRAAFEDGVTPDLGRFAVEEGLLSAKALDDLLEATGRGPGVGEGLIELGYTDTDGLDQLLRRHLDALVAKVFEWESGEFSFDIGGLHTEGAEREFLLSQGLNPQFAALEAARLLDEAGGAAGGAGRERVSASTSDQEEATDDELDFEAAFDLAPTPTAVARAKQTTSLPVVAVDTDLATLEWIKGALEPTGARIHILQRSEEAVARVRQYLLRGEAAVALLTSSTPPDSVSGAEDWAAIASRLRAQVPTQLILYLSPEGTTPSGLDPKAQPNGSAERPDPTVLSDPRAEPRRADLSDRLRVALAAVQGIEPVRISADPWRAKWEGVRDKLRHAPTRNAVWSDILDFAAEGFERTALFTITEEEATSVGARIRREAEGDADSPSPEASLAVGESTWLRKVVEMRCALRAGPSDEGDRALFRGLGDECPDEAFLAPIERCGTLVAVLYGDNAIRRGTVPDTRPLEPVLKEAGLALERLPATQ